MQLFSSEQRWSYAGVLHEYPVCDGSFHAKTLEGLTYHRLGGGGRSADGKKFERDIKVLQNELQKHPVMCGLVPELAEAWVDREGRPPMFVSVHRPVEDIVRSWERPEREGNTPWWPRPDRDEAIADLIRRRDQSLDQHEHCVVDFRQLRKDPHRVITNLAQRCGLSLDAVDDAVSLVR